MPFSGCGQELGQQGHSAIKQTLLMSIEPLIQYHLAREHGGADLLGLRARITQCDTTDTIVHHQTSTTSTTTNGGHGQGWQLHQHRGH